jgi:hypothetical protein
MPVWVTSHSFPSGALRSAAGATHDPNAASPISLFRMSLALTQTMAAGVVGLASSVLALIVLIVVRP